MADLFVTLVSIVPKPTTVAVTKPQSDNSSNNGLFPSIQQNQVITAGVAK